MMLRLYKTAIYFKQFFSSVTFNKSAFYRLCEKVEKFPLKEDYVEIKGLFLSGENFFKRILLSEARDLDLDEIEQIRRIVPIVDHGPMPFIMEQSYFEVNLPTEGKSFEKLMESISIIDDYLDDLFEDATGKKVEIHLRGGSDRNLSRCIYTKAIPNLSEGTYRYEVMEGEHVDSGEVSLPSEFSKLPESIKKFVEVISGRYTIKLIDRKNRVIFKQLKKQEIGLSLYSDQSLWFKNALDTCEKAQLFEQYFQPPERYRLLPHLTGAQKRV